MATDICVELGKNIRAIRKAKGWRQIDLAEHSGLGKNHISELERGQREAGLKAIKAIADGLGVDLANLMRNL